MTKCQTDLSSLASIVGRVEQQGGGRQVCRSMMSCPEMHFIMKTRRFAHFIMKTPAGKRPIPPKPMSTIGLTKPAHQQQFFHRAHTSIVQKILGFSRRFPGFSRRILGKFSGCFFSMFFTHKTVVNAPWASQHFENI